MTRILALDLGDSCGYAWRTAPSDMISGALDLSFLTDVEHPGARWTRVRKRLMRLVIQACADVICWEKIVTPPKRVSSFSPANLFGLEAQLVVVAYDLGKATLTVMPSSLKKFAVGCGNAKKAELREAGRARWGMALTTETHDEIDARWVLEWAEAELASVKA